MSRNTSLPVSAQECAASASIDDDPVTTAATDFATATRRLAAKAMRTVVRLAESPPLAARESWPRNRSDFTAAPSFEGGICRKHRRAPGGALDRSQRCAISSPSEGGGRLDER